MPKTTPTIKKLFIANRGEIARRIALSAKKIGIPSVAIYSGAQPHAFLLDVVSEFVWVPEENTSLYLNAAQMLQLAKQSGCNAIHPGFGFLSENAAFAQSCIDAGMIWIGPSPAAIAAMASKAAAKDIARQAGVPIIPGLQNVTFDAQKPDHTQIEQFGKTAGYPLLFKATMGGGGKGMRIAHQASDIPEALQRAASEGLNSFGDGTLIVERYLTSPRHIEVQVFGDQHGNITAFGDRDCSLQRRHQKIIEEAPAPELSSATRQAMRAAAINLAKSVNYVSAGTVEFLVDWSEAARRQDPTPFFFLEMNTRLQVEHPVTEEIFGIDLVEWQLSIAQNERLPAEFLKRESRGHSIELRIYAEDTLQNFLPAPGPVLAFVPAQGPGIRWEIGVDTTDTVTAAFDPMVAKLIATGETRQAAIARLVHAIDTTLLAGPKNNLAWLRQVLTTAPFKDGAIATDFIAQYSTKIAAALSAETDRVRNANAAALTQLCTRGIDAQQYTDQRSPSHAEIVANAFGNKNAVSTFSTTDNIRIASTLHSSSPFLPRTQVTFGRAIAQNNPVWYVVANDPEQLQHWLACGAITVHSSKSKNESRASKSADKSAPDLVTAPVPGKIVAIKIEAGRTASEGDILLVIESMKMEFEIRATRGGKIKSVNKTQGEQVNAGDLLVVFAGDAKE